MKRWNVLFNGKAARTETGRNNEAHERLYWASAHQEPEVLKKYGTPVRGLSPEKAEEKRDEYGENILTCG